METSKLISWCALQWDAFALSANPFPFSSDSNVINKSSTKLNRQKKHTSLRAMEKAWFQSLRSILWLWCTGPCFIWRVIPGNTRGRGGSETGREAATAGPVTRSSAALDNSKATALGSCGRQRGTHTSQWRAKRELGEYAPLPAAMGWCLQGTSSPAFGSYVWATGSHARIETLRQRHSYSQKPCSRWVPRA